MSASTLTCSNATSRNVRPFESRSPVTTASLTGRSNSIVFDQRVEGDNPNSGADLSPARPTLSVYRPKRGAAIPNQHLRRCAMTAAQLCAAGGWTKRSSDYKIPVAGNK